MEWFFLIVILIVAYYLVILKPGRLDFWKIASRHPDDVFELFQQQDCWQVFIEKPEVGYNSELPNVEWDGPFKLAVPKLRGRLITVYGKVPDYEKPQQEFMVDMKGKS